MTALRGGSPPAVTLSQAHIDLASLREKRILLTDLLGADNRYLLFRVTPLHSVPAKARHCVAAMFSAAMRLRADVDGVALIEERGWTRDPISGALRMCEPHFHGLLKLSSDADNDEIRAVLKDTWCKVQHRWAGPDVFLAGPVGPIRVCTPGIFDWDLAWTGEPDENRGGAHRWLSRYMIKHLAPDSVPARVVAGGDLAPVYGILLGDVGTSSRSMAPASSTPSGPQCRWCGCVLKGSSGGAPRAHKKTCSARCRQALHRQTALPAPATIANAVGALPLRPAASDPLVARSVPNAAQSGAHVVADDVDRTSPAGQLISTPGDRSNTATSLLDVSIRGAPSRKLTIATSS